MEADGPAGVAHRSRHHRSRRSIILRAKHNWRVPSSATTVKQRDDIRQWRRRRWILNSHKLSQDLIFNQIPSSLKLIQMNLPSADPAMAFEFQLQQAKI